MKLVRFLVVALCVLCVSSAEAGVLAYELDRLGQMVKGFDTDTKAIEAQYLELASNHTKPEELGNIYYHLADMYIQSGLTDPASAIKYGNKALEYPLTDSQRIAIGIIIGSALKRQSVRSTGQGFAEARRQIARPLLEAVRYSLDKSIPEVKLPPVESPSALDFRSMDTGYDARLTDEQIQKLEVERKEKERQVQAIREEYMAVCKNREEVNKCVDERASCLDSLVSGYTKRPYDTDELKRMGMEIVKDERIVDSLVARVEKVIDERGEKNEARPTSRTLVVTVATATTGTKTPAVLLSKPSSSTTPQQLGVVPSSAPSKATNHPWVALGIGAASGLAIVTAVLAWRMKR